MKIIKSASNDSQWRGLDYYEGKKVLSIKKINNYEYSGIVQGNGQKYNVYLNLDKVRSSTCNCPFAKDRKIICKHMVASYFQIFPEEVEVFLKEVEEHNKKVDEYNDNLRKETIKYLNALPKKEIISKLIDVIDMGPDWLYDKFLQDSLYERDYKL